MGNPLFRGSGVALVTPFTEHGVDFETLGKLIDWQIESGTDALVVCGTTGEASTMTEQEKIAVIDYSVQRVAGRIPVIAGTGSNVTANAIKASKDAQERGADGLLIVTPYYNKTTQAGLIAHYRAIADAVKIPIIAYNVPSRTGLNVLPETMAEMANHPNIRGMKEASADITQITELARLCGEKISLYSGNDDHVLPLLVLGGEGVITTVGNVAPREMHELVTQWFDGDIEGAREIQFLLNPLVKSLFLEVNPIPVKAALALMGFRVGHPRLPLIDAQPATVEKLKRALADFAAM